MKRVVVRAAGPELEGTVGDGALAQRLRELLGVRTGPLLLGGERLGRRRLGHRVLVLEARLVDLEGRREVEDRLAALDGDDAPRRERAAVADAVDVVDDRLSHVAGAKEVGVERVHVALGRDRLHRGGERLTEHLAAEHRSPPEVLALAAEEVLLDSLEGEELDELVEDALRHDAPRFARSPTDPRSTALGHDTGRGKSGMFFMKSPRERADSTAIFEDFAAAMPETRHEGPGFRTLRLR